LAEFYKAYQLTIAHEGGYSNHPSDKGGETFMGISRVHNSDWRGWGIIDAVKLNKDDIVNNKKLLDLVYNFYRERYWRRINGSRIPDQDIANELFDTAVNMGVLFTVMLLQKTLNLLNRNQKLYKDIKVDGVFGDKTFLALDQSINKNGSVLVQNILNCYQAKRYLEIMERSKDQEIFIGWFNRVEIIRRAS
jgi:lysozyme family protein